MLLDPGTRLGPYQIRSLCGKGGMGEVYRAHDSRLDRDVAVKVLPAEVSQDPVWKRRLEQEAKAICRLQHPNVCTLFDAAFGDGRDYLVMEYLAGETLADRLRHGALPLVDVLRTGAEVAEAIDAAHRLGIVHGDLKPGNVMLTRTGAKVLDFGLAQAFTPPAPAVAPDAPTMTRVEPGRAITGTLLYMAPEQLEGGRVDARSDLWALGCVLYEMASGRRAFEGDSVASAIAAVMTSRPRALREGPSGLNRLDRLIAGCLEHDPDRRWQSAHDVALALVALAGESEESEAPVRSAPTAGAPVRVLRSSLELPDRTRLTRPDLSMSCPVAIAPDGGSVVFAAVRDGESRLYRRSLEEYDAAPLEGTEGATAPFFSPDGRWIAFHASGWLQKIASSGGQAVPIRKLPAFVGAGADWDESDRIVVSPSALGSGLLLFSADGREARPLTRLDHVRGEWHHAWPQFLPGGRNVLFTIWGWKSGGANVVSLETGEVRLIRRGAIGARLVGPDAIVFRNAFSPELLAARFDPERLEVIGDARPVQDRVHQTARAGGSGSFSVSRTGTLVYEPAGRGKRSLALLDREGQVLERIGDPAPYEAPAISPDGRRVAFQLNEWGLLPERGHTGSGGDIWVHDLERDTRDRLTHRGDNLSATWSPDGEQIAFSSNRDGPWNLYIKAVDGAGEARRWVETTASLFPASISPDGSVLCFEERTAEGTATGFVTREGEMLSSAGMRFAGAMAGFSPDGRFIVYAAEDSGRREIYVQAYPPAGQRFKISLQGGTEPRFSPRGDEIFYRRGDELWTVPIETRPSFRPGRPRLLFSAPFDADSYTNSAVYPDGQRFLIVEREPDRPLRLVVGWVDDLCQRLTDS
jgi:serine/threonine-protein kinase